jgi:hypothetical protein
MDEQQKNKKIVYLTILVVFAVLIMLAFLKVKGSF